MNSFRIYRVGNDEMFKQTANNQHQEFRNGEGVASQMLLYYLLADAKHMDLWQCFFVSVCL